jgi:transcriptional regulator with XRE-family HTH domain
LHTFIYPGRNFEEIIYTSVLFMSIGQRIQELRKEKGFSQTDLAEKVGISYAQISRYETKGAQPPAEVLSKLAQTLNTSVDYIIYGNAHEKATATLNDAKLISYFKEVEKMPDEEKGTVLKVLAALIHEYKTQQVFAL